MNHHGLLTRALSAHSALTPADHDALLMRDRPAYAALLDVPAVSPPTSMQIVIRLLAVTDGDRDLTTENRRITAALARLPTAVVLDGFDTLVERRVNNQRTSGTVRSFLFGCPHLEDLAVAHKTRLARLITHALGRRTVSTCLHFFERKDARAVRYVRRHILRFAVQPDVVADVVRFVFGRLTSTTRNDGPIGRYLAARAELSKGAGLPYNTLRGIASTYHRGAPRHLVPRLSASLKVKRAVDGATATGDHPLVAALKAYLDDRRPERWAVVEAAVTPVAETLPAIVAPRWAVVLDASASMAGSGQRANHSLAIAVAWWLLLKAKAPRAELRSTGDRFDDRGLPVPGGATALAPALIEAARTAPDGIVVLSDGYENQLGGDAADVLRAFRALGIETPIAHVLPAFTDREQVAERSPLGPPLLETGDRDFIVTWLRLTATLMPAHLPALLRAVSEGGNEA